MPLTDQQLQTLLADPTLGPQVRAWLQSQGAQPQTLMSAIGNIGQAMSHQTTPQGQAATGIGGALGAGLYALTHRKKTNMDPMAGRSGLKPTNYDPEALSPPQLEPNQMDPSDRPPIDVNDLSPKSHMYDMTDLAYGLPDDGFRKGGRVKRAFAAGGEVEAPPKPAKKGVLVRRPVIAIVITPHGKPGEKPEKKARGGTIHPRKPEALPPKRGPESSGPPSPFKKGGHVQVPRGFGAAERGKRFRGIY